jgi:tryptophan synthase alpha subunit
VTLPPLTLPLMQALVAGGADIIELGVPFSDPMADGPTIQRASERAIAAGMSMRKVLDIVRSFRATGDETPVVLMGYANPIEAMGVEPFTRAAAEAGADGVLVVDYPPRNARVRRQLQGGRARSGLPAGAHLHRAALCRRGGGQRLHLLCLAQGCHGLGDPRPR